MSLRVHAEIEIRALVFGVPDQLALSSRSKAQWWTDDSDELKFTLWSTGLAHSHC